MKRALKKSVRMLISLLVVSSLLTGCSGTAANTKGGYSLKVGMIPGSSARCGLVVAASELGYYEAEGVDVEFIPIDPATSMSALSSGKIDVYPFAIVPTLTQIAQGAPYTIVAGTATEGMSLVAGKDDADIDYHEFNNWEGKKIGYVARSCTVRPLYLELFREKGVDSSLIEWTEFADEQSVLEGLQKGQLNAGFLSQERVAIAKETGLNEALQNAEVFPNNVCCRQTAYKENVENNREAYIKYVRAQLRAYHDYRDDNAKVLDAVAKYGNFERDYVEQYLNTKSEVDSGTLVQVRNPLTVDPMLDKVTDLYKAYVSEGLIEETAQVDLKDYVDVSIFNEAINQLVKENPNDETYKLILEKFKDNNSVI